MGCSCSQASVVQTYESKLQNVRAKEKKEAETNCVIKLGCVFIQKWTEEESQVRSGTKVIVNMYI
jgi:hypothetical protein